MQTSTVSHGTGDDANGELQFVDGGKCGELTAKPKHPAAEAEVECNK